MCGICGCNEEQGKVITSSHGESELVYVEQDILKKNKQFAKINQHYFSIKKILALNIMSSPGSGKTTLLAKTIIDLQNKITTAVIVGDQQTDDDAQIIQASGGLAVQINTGKICHLDAHMIGHALEKLPVQEKMIIFIENIGNLVCPALFYLGENYKIVILSVTEGDNKPLKYPDMFYHANVMILTKIDLLPYVKFNVNECIKRAKQINPQIKVFMLSSTKGEGLAEWYDWLIQKKNDL